MKTIWLIKRGPRPAHHRAPLHPVIVCAKKRVAKWESGATDELACVWEHDYSEGGSGWLWTRWMGLDIDYGHVVRSMPLPNGERVAFVHDRDKEPWTLLQGAIWWDNKPMPAWVMSAGVLYPPDEFTRNTILSMVANDGFSGLGRQCPSFWPPADNTAGNPIWREEPPHA